MTPADLNCVKYLKLPVHVDMVDGNDGAEGSEGQPVKTIAHAAAIVKALDISQLQTNPSHDGRHEPFGATNMSPEVREEQYFAGCAPVIRMHCGDS
jgi:hypothetical protein